MEDELKVVKKEELGKLMNTSRSAEIYEFGEGKILKLYLPQYPDDDIETEYRNTLEAYNKGATPMHIYGLVTCDNRKGIILEKINGVTQIERFLKHFPYLFTAGKDLAKLHLLVHSKTTDVMRDYKTVVIKLLDEDVFNFLSEKDKAKLVFYLKSLPDDNKIIHLDFHVNNVLMTEKNDFVVIDWMTACKGSPLAELAMMDFLLKQAELFPGISKIEALVFSICKKILYHGFMKSYLKATGFKKKDFKPYRISILIFRYGTWKIESESTKIIKEMQKFVSSLPEAE